MDKETLHEFKTSTIGRLHFRIGELARMLGLSTRQLRYWEKQGYIVSLPRQNNETSRLFGFDTYLKASALKTLIDEGHSLKKAVEIAEAHIEEAKTIHDIMKHSLHDVVELDGKRVIILGQLEGNAKQDLIAYYEDGQTRYKLIDKK